jgi:alkylhydroperoxidase family enzyme
MHVRVAEAQQQGLTEEDIGHLSNPSGSTLSDCEQTALLFAELIITSPSGITDALFDEMRRWFSDSEIVEFCFFVLTYNTAQRFNAAIDLDPEAGEDIVVRFR